MDRSASLREQQVHALRHEFTMSGHLSGLLRDFLVDDARHVQLNVYGSKVSLLPQAQYDAGDYDEQRDTIAEHFRQYDRDIYLSGRLVIKPITNVFARIAFWPKSQAAFDTLVTELGTLPELLHDPPGAHHYLYTDVALSALSNSVQQRQQAMNAFREAAKQVTTMHYQWVSPLRIVGANKLLPQQMVVDSETPAKDLRDVS